MHTTDPHDILLEQDELKLLLYYAGALSNQHTLRILSALIDTERSAEELAELLNIRPTDIGRHLGQLVALELITRRDGDGRRSYRFAPNGLRRMSRAVGAVSKDAFANHQRASAAGAFDGEAEERKILQNFFDGPRLKEIPVSHKKKLVVLHWLTLRFEEDRTYPEREVNEILKRHHPDFATLRRDLVDFGFMYRQDGIYWRLPLPALAERLQQEGDKR